MNERIRNLAEQCDFYVGNEHYNESHEEKQRLWVEKFAELIVRECYEHCRGQVLDKGVADTNELTYNDAVGDCANGLLQHFGVEE